MNKLFDFAIIGGGIVGLSTALQLQQLGKDVLVLEKEQQPGLHQSGRNSGVIHSGIYYKPNSLKSTLCVRGRELLIDFALAEKISHRIEGKIIVDNDLERIEALYQRSLELQMSNVEVITKQKILQYEPYCKFHQALYVPQAGVIDYKEVTKKIAEKFISKGGSIEFFQEIKEIQTLSSFKQLTSNSNKFTAQYLINCAGLYSDSVAQLDRVNPKLRIIPFRGEYFTIQHSKQSMVNNMIYPISNPDLPFLGIHLTKNIYGEIEAGPNAVLAFSKEGYKWGSVNFREFSKTISYPGMWKLGKQYFSTGISEMYRSLNKNVFLNEILKYIPNITKKDLHPRLSGVRAQAVGVDGKLIDDFVFEEGEQSLHVLNAPSPAATASFAIGEYIAKKVI